MNAAILLLLASFGLDAAPVDVDGGASDALAADAGAPPDLAPTPPRVTVRGQILSMGDRRKLGAVALLVDGQPAGETEPDGTFTLALPPGRHVLQASASGFELSTRTVSEADVAAPILWRLLPTASAPVYQTTVRAPAPEGPRTTLEGDEIRKTPGALGDPFRVIESLPGVAPIIATVPVYSIRGANPGNTGFFVDGLRVPALFHFALGPAVIHPHFVETVDFYPGGYPATLGRYVAGVVAAGTRAPPRDRAHGSVDLRLYDVGAMVSTPTGGDGTLAVAGRYSYTAGVLSLVQSDASISYWDYQGRYERRLGGGRLTVFAFGSSDRLAPKDPEDADDALSIRFHRLDLRWSAPLGRGRFRSALAGGFDETTAPFEEDNPLRVRGLSLAPRLAYDAPLGTRVDLTTGVDAELQDFSTTLPASRPELASFTRPRKVLQSALYVSALVRLGERLVLTPGLRGAAYVEGGTSALSPEPRLSLRVKLREWLFVQAAGGRFTQMPSLPLQLPGFEGFGLARHGLQRSWQGSLGVELAAARWGSLNVTGFLQRYVLTDIRDFESGDPLLDDFLIARDAASYGVEVLAKRPVGARLHGWVAYTLSRSVRAYEGGLVAPSDWDQRHLLNLVAGWRWRRNLVGLRFHLHTGRLVRVQDSPLPEYRRLPAFYQLDLRAEHRFYFDRFYLDVYLELVNSTLNPQVVGWRRDFDGRLEQESFRIILPSLGVRAEF